MVCLTAFHSPASLSAPVVPPRAALDRVTTIPNPHPLDALSHSLPFFASNVSLPRTSVSASRLWMKGLATSTLGRWPAGAISGTMTRWRCSEQPRAGDIAVRKWGIGLSITGAKAAVTSACSPLNHRGHQRAAMTQGPGAWRTLSPQLARTPLHLLLYSLPN